MFRRKCHNVVGKPMSTNVRNAGIWIFRIVAVVLILYGLLILAWAQPVRTPGNTQIWFAGELSSSASRDLDAAYERLCQTEKERISFESFYKSGGAEYSVLSQGTVSGGGLEYPQDHELPDGVEEVWTELIVDRSFQGGAVEVWRLHQTRERDWWELKGDWKICGIEQSDPA